MASLPAACAPWHDRGVPRGRQSAELTDIIVPEYGPDPGLRGFRSTIGIGIGGVISGDSLFGRHQDAARAAVADMAARLEEAGGLLIDAQWDNPVLRSLGAEPMPREDCLPLLGPPAEQVARWSRPPPAPRLLGPG